MDFNGFLVNPFPQEYAHTRTHVSTHVHTGSRMRSHTKPPACTRAPYVHPHTCTRSRAPRPHSRTCTRHTHMLTPHAPTHLCTAHTSRIRTRSHVHPHTRTRLPRTPALQSPAASHGFLPSGAFSLTLALRADGAPSGTSSMGCAPLRGAAGQAARVAGPHAPLRSLPSWTHPPPRPQSQTHVRVMGCSGCASVEGDAGRLLVFQLLPPHGERL